MGGWGGGGEVDHRPPSPVICKSHEAMSCSKARSLQITPAISV